MYGQGQLLNKRPNMKLFGNLNAGAREEDDEDDDFATSSFTKSKVDDDDDKFNRDPDFLDIFGKKQPPKKIIANSPPQKPEQVDKFVKPDAFAKNKTPKPESSAKKIDTNKTPKPESSSKKIDISKTPQQESSNSKTTPKPESKKINTLKTPQPESNKKIETSKSSQQESSKKIDNSQTPKQDSSKKIDNTKTPKQQASSPVKETGARKPAQSSEKKEPKPAPIQVQASPKPMIEKKQDKKIDQVDAPQEKDVQFNQLQRPQFVRKGKTSAAALIQKLNSYDHENDQIRAINPKNKRECIRDLMMRENPAYYDEKNQEVFSDQIFPANVSQIEQLPWKCKQIIEFKRAAAYYKRPVEAYSVIDPNDITPGEFQTQGLMSVLSSFSEQPSILARVLESQKINKTGFYYVRLFVDGVWRYVTIDDMLCSQRSGPSDDDRVKKLAKNSVGYETELWVSLIEKGLSKVYTSYKDMQFGTVEDFMWELTGAPVLRDYHTIGLAELQGIGLPKGLLVNILGCEKGEVKLRNPWGWLNGVKVGKLVGNEGEFTMSEKEFEQRVIQCWGSSYVEGYWSISHSVRQLMDNYSGFKINIKEDGECYWSIVQLDQRYFRNNLVQKYKYSFVRIVVLSEDGEIIGSGYGDQKYVRTQKVNVFSGNYYVFVIFDWEDKCYESTLSYYGSQNIKISQIDQNEDMLGKLMGMTAIKQGQKKGGKGGVSEYQYVDKDMNLFSIGWESQSSNVVKKDLSKFTILRKPASLSITVNGIEGVVGKSKDGKFNL